MRCTRLFLISEKAFKEGNSWILGQNKKIVCDFIIFFLNPTPCLIPRSLMPRIMNSLFHFLSNWRNLLLLFGLIIIANLLLGIYMPKAQALDLKFAYTPDEAFAAISELNEEERSRYKLGLLAFDMPYLVIYCLFFSGILLKLWKKKWILLIPSSIMFFDFFENVLVLQLLKNFPDQNEMLALFASVFTSGKWVMVGVLFVSIVSGLIFLLLNRTKPKGFSEKNQI